MYSESDKLCVDNFVQFFVFDLGGSREAFNFEYSSLSNKTSRSII